MRWGVEDRRTHDRRVGPRVTIDPLPVGWRIAAPDASRRDQRRARPETGALLDLSVSGALVAARPANDLSVGAVLHMAIDGQVGKVRIRRILPTASRKEVHFGVEFCDVDCPLTRYVHEHMRSVSARPDAWGGRRADERPIR